jgi:hypothetical protein
VSSTYYDLKHIRSSLENFIEQLGFEPILSEKGDIAYAPDIPLDESCYREIRNSDVFVLIVGGRYGSEKSEHKSKVSKEFYDRYDSITKQEYNSAVERDIPVYIMIEKAVYADFETYLRNKSNKSVDYAHVDSINVFYLIEEIVSKRKNNPIYYFDRYIDIEIWLKEQWAGLFKELLSRMNSQQQLLSLSSQVRELSEMNKTLKAYLEEVVAKIAPEESLRIIKKETNRLDEALQGLVIENNSLTTYLRSCDLPLDAICKAVVKSSTIKEFVEELKINFPENPCLSNLLSKHRKEAEKDFMEMKNDLANPELSLRSQHSAKIQRDDLTEETT